MSDKLFSLSLSQTSGHSMRSGKLKFAGPELTERQINIHNSTVHGKSNQSR
jgi:hypothetical protein